tara:strand:- start:610 stop:990 length:381 start_codon:yes stop_codon:yes gene_type:complete
MKNNRNLMISSIGATTFLCVSLLMMTGCDRVGEGATFGAGIGALAGQAIGGNTEATLIGAGVGALLGGAIGNDQQKSSQQYRNADGSYTTRRSTTRKVLNPDGTYTTVGQETTVSEQTQDGYVGLP